MTSADTAPTAGTTESVDVAPTPDPAEKKAASREQLKNELRWGAVFLMWFMFVITAIFSGYSNWTAAPAGAENRSTMTSELFGTSTAPNAPNWVAPFEVLSVLLLAALIAAVVIALREGSE